MLTLLHHPFCPHSRFIRLALAEHGLEHRTIEERVWERRQEFLMLNPAATTPVLIAEGYPPVPGAATIAEFLDETSGAELQERRLMPADIRQRIEVRRLAAWFNEKFFAEVSRARWCWSASTSGSCASSRAAARPTPTRSVRRGSMSAIISPISDGWCAPAIGWPATR